MCGVSSAVRKEALHGEITGDGAEGGGALKRNLWRVEGVAETALFSIHVVIVEFLTKREQTSELYLFETWFFTDAERKRQAGH